MLIAAALTSAACSGGSTSGTPSPSPSANSTAPQSLAPKITEPITDTSSIEADPCSAVPVTVVESAGGRVKKTAVDDSDLGKDCAWTFDGTGNVSGGLVTANKDGLNGLYIQHARGALTTFKPQPSIQGYPAVVYDNGGEGLGACNLAVGIRDDVTYTVITQLRDGNPALQDPCSMATALASAAITHLKG
ncbi:DUF3558 domain-containing protein [Amycolatopsis carbonis]|uniref:DUF3558 domain-containing protein n=1 Tax=Amycolatopsis carbonis TaxID=715471 RepID=A0A9Y2MW81_9PSEU|nr:DUF3558 domain-containing protein [Amycolatopsis sp. 2-15]WIX80861.1 DUF3558 domain-containing protein [Amycolatopsis sp. 2-15]